MATTKTTKAAKPAAEKKPAAKKPAPKTETKAAEKPAAAAKSAAPKKPAASGATLTLVQIASPIGRREYQRATLVGLGLNKMHRRSVLQDTPAVRGMIERVKHLVRVEK